jgi:hypothetical protein
MATVYFVLVTRGQVAMSRHMQRRKKGNTNARWRAVTEADSFPDPAYQYRMDPKESERRKESAQENPYNQQGWIKFDEFPAPGYITSVLITPSPEGSRILFVGVGIAPAGPLDALTDLPPWTSVNGGIIKGLNEQGITARVLKQLNLTDIKRKAVASLDGLGPSGIPHFDEAMRLVKDGLSPGRRQEQTPEKKAELAAAYLAQVNELGGHGVYERLGKELNYAPSTLRSRIKQLRSEGYLTSAAPGVAGGALTDRSRSILGLA